MGKTYTIYILENKVNGKRYVGQTTVPLKKRLYQHQHSDDSVISRAIKKYGFDNFEITSFAAPSLDALNKLEVALIAELDCLVSKSGYNIKKGGRNSEWTADEKAHLRDVWDGAKRGKASRKQKRALQRRIGRCENCGKDETMGYNPDLDFRFCPSCRHVRHLSKDLGIS